MKPQPVSVHKNEKERDRFLRTFEGFLHRICTITKMIKKSGFSYQRKVEYEERNIQRFLFHNY